MRHTVKAGTCKDQGIEEDVHTFQSPSVLIGNAKMSDEVVCKITKAIVEGRAEYGNVVKTMEGITAADMAQNFGVRYHPGAEKYYREAGLLKK